MVSGILVQALALLRSRNSLYMLCVPDCKSFLTFKGFFKYSWICKIYHSISFVEISSLRELTSLLYNDRYLTRGRWRQRVRRCMRWKGEVKIKAESKTDSQMSTCSSSGLIEIIRRVDVKGWCKKNSPDECLKLVWADETEREVEGPRWKDNQTSTCSSSGW